MAEDLLALEAELVAAKQEAEEAKKWLSEARAKGLDTTSKEGIYTSSLAVVAAIRNQIVEGIAMSSCHLPVHT